MYEGTVFSRRRAKKHGVEKRIKYSVTVTIDANKKECELHPVTNWGNKTSIFIDLSCVGVNHQSHFPNLKISRQDKEEYYGSTVTLTRKCQHEECVKDCVLTLVNWCPKNTVMHPGVPTVIAEIEVAGFHLEGGEGRFRFGNQLKVKSTVTKATGTLDPEEGAKVMLCGKDGSVEMVTINSISVAYARVQLLLMRGSPDIY